MAKVGGRRGVPKKERDKIKTDNMKDAAAGTAPQLPNMPKPRDLKHHYATILGFKDRMETARALYNNACKQAEDAGIDVKALKDAMTKSKKDPLALKTYYLQLAEHFKELGLPFQISLFDTLKGTPEEQAYKQGFDIGESGKTPENPYPEGSPPYSEYQRGVAHGIGKNLGQTPEQVDAALGTGGVKTGDGAWPDDEQIAEREGEEVGA